MPHLSTQSHLLKGNVFLSKGHYHQAILSYKAFLKTEPGNIVAHNNLGVAYHKSGNIQEAVFSYQNAIKRKTDYYDAVYNLAVLLKNENIFIEAIHYFHQAIQIDKKNVLPLIGLAQTLSHLGEIEKSTSVYMQALQLSPNNYEVVTEAAKQEMQLKHFVQAEILFTRALLINKKNPYAWQHLALSLKMQGKIYKALECLKIAISLNPHISSLHYLMGIICYEMGAMSNALEHIEKAFALDPSLKEDYNFLPILKNIQIHTN